MLGTDYPIFSPDQVTHTLEAAELGDADKAMILRGTAERVLGSLA
jgi:predicted TIM-barrel fold metal-dependent hydrolase